MSVGLCVPRGTRGANVPAMANDIHWNTDYDAAVSSAGDKLVLLDFSAAPM
jgi:hypothetical protein